MDRERGRIAEPLPRQGIGARAGRPTASALLYLAEGEPKGAQLFVRWVDADGPATQITHVSEAPRNARWSPDGKSIAFSMFVRRTGEVDDQHAGRAEGREVDARAARRVGTLHYRQDQVGFLEDGFTHLFVVPADGGTPRQLSRPASGASARASCAAARPSTGRPTASRLSSTATASPDADMQYETSQIYRRRRRDRQRSAIS